MENVNINIEIGGNLRAVLMEMVDKVSACQSSSYYEYAFAPIKEAIIGVIKEGVNYAQKTT